MKMKVKAIRQMLEKMKKDASIWSVFSRKTNFVKLLSSFLGKQKHDEDKVSLDDFVNFLEVQKDGDKLKSEFFEYLAQGDDACHKYFKGWQMHEFIVSLPLDAPSLKFSDGVVLKYSISSEGSYFYHNRKDTIVFTMEEKEGLKKYKFTSTEKDIGTFECGDTRMITIQARTVVFCTTHGLFSCDFSKLPVDESKKENSIIIKNESFEKITDLDREEGYKWAINNLVTMSNDQFAYTKYSRRHEIYNSNDDHHSYETCEYDAINIVDFSAKNKLKQMPVIKLASISSVFWSGYYYRFEITAWSFSSDCQEIYCSCCYMSDHRDNWHYFIAVLDNKGNLKRKWPAKCSGLVVLPSGQLLSFDDGFSRDEDENVNAVIKYSLCCWEPATGKKIAALDFDPQDMSLCDTQEGNSIILSGSKRVGSGIVTVPIKLNVDNNFYSLFIDSLKLLIVGETPLIRDLAEIIIGYLRGMEPVKVSANSSMAIQSKLRAASNNRAPSVNHKNNDDEQKSVAREHENNSGQLSASNGSSSTFFIKSQARDSSVKSTTYNGISIHSPALR